MAGVAANLAAALDEHCRPQGFARIDRARPTRRWPRSVRLLAREALTGASRRRPRRGTMVDLWRPWLDEHGAARTVGELDRALADQDAYRRRRSAELLAAISTSSSATPTTSEPDEDQDERASEAEATRTQSRAARATAQAAESPRRPRAMPTASAEDDAEDGRRRDADERDDARRASDDDPGGPAGRRSSTARPAATSRLYQRLHAPSSTRWSTADELCDADELTRLRHQLDQQLAHLQGVIGAARQPAAAPAAGAADRAPGSSISRRACSTPRACRASWSTRSMPLSYKREQETEFRDTVVTLLIDNSGSMRGRPITVAAMSADILARTLERCGVKVEILGFTTRAWKGGQSRERWLARRQARQPRPAQRSAPHRLQAGRRAVAARAHATSA